MLIIHDLYIKYRNWISKIWDSVAFLNMFQQLPWDIHQRNWNLDCKHVGSTPLNWTWRYPKLKMNKKWWEIRNDEMFHCRNGGCWNTFWWFKKRCPTHHQQKNRWHPDMVMKAWPQSVVATHHGLGESGVVPLGDLCPWFLVNASIARSHVKKKTTTPDRKGCWNLWYARYDFPLKIVR